VGDWSWLGLQWHRRCRGRCGRLLCDYEVWERTLADVDNSAVGGW